MSFSRRCPVKSSLSISILLKLICLIKQQLQLLKANQQNLSEKFENLYLDKGFNRVSDQFIV